ncbi:MAG: TlpA family protein disulfide reductase [Candidatus Rokubacteria bacterium]|nr:TlpA family protein disulfide reductase [Candidatus Rokubacteria bacterium]
MGLVVALLVSVSPATVSDASDIQPAVGHRAPDFVLRDPDGRPVQLSRVLGAKAVLLNFWATWCPPCREEMPTMERAYHDYKARGLEVVAVSIDAGSEVAVAAKVKAFMKELKLTFPAVLDPNGEVVHRYRLRGLPMTFLIDRSGEIRSADLGFRDWSDAAARKKLDALVK